MIKDVNEPPRGKPSVSDSDAPSNPNDPLAGQASKKGSFFQRFQDMLETNRGTEREAEPASHIPETASAAADDLALRRAKAAPPAGSPAVSSRRMIIPEGVVISGSVSSGAETEISGRVDGDVTVEGRLYLGPTALISGNVRATACKVEGLVEGKMECSQEIELGRTGRLNADAMAGKKATVAGQVFGNVATGGMLHLVATGRIEGNVQTRQLVMEEGSVFNGRCGMRAPAPQRSDK